MPNAGPPSYPALKEVQRSAGETAFAESKGVYVGGLLAVVITGCVVGVRAWQLASYLEARIPSAGGLFLAVTVLCLAAVLAYLIWRSFRPDLRHELRIRGPARELVWTEHSFFTGAEVTLVKADAVREVALVHGPWRESTRRKVWKVQVEFTAGGSFVLDECKRREEFLPLAKAVADGLGLSLREETDKTGP